MEPLKQPRTVLPPGTRNDKGRWVKGATGRTVGPRNRHVSLAKMLRQGIEFHKIAEQLQSIALTAPDLDTRLRAIKLIYDRAFGQAPQTIQLDTQVTQAPQHDLSGLSPAELERMRENLTQVATILQPHKVIDVEALETFPDTEVPTDDT